LCSIRISVRSGPPSRRTASIIFCCDRVVFLAQGEVIASGSPAEVEKDPALREIYFGSGAA
jgi:ABC-type branched-subunit amino acid transport system ATPase component